MTDRLDARPLPAVRLDDVVVLAPGDDADAGRAVGGVAVSVDESGVTLASASAHVRHVLSWSALETYVVEPVGASPARWWEDPELRDPVDPERRDPMDPELRDPVDTAPGPAPARRRQGSASERAAAPGALVSLRTAAGTYRLLVPGADSDALAARLRPLAAAHLPPEALPTVTTAAMRPAATPPVRTRWQRVRPVLAVLAAALAAAAITVILLQSAGVVHLPYLGGTGPTALAPPHAGPAAGSALRR